MTYLPFLRPRATKAGARIGALVSLGALSLIPVLGGCTVPASDEEGGANTNDRSEGGNDGAALLTGSMVLSPPSRAAAGEEPAARGTYGLMQRNTVSVLVDFEKETAQELDFMVGRWVFSPVEDIAFAVIEGDLVALELPSLEELWRAPSATGSIGFVRVSEDGRSLVTADGSEGRVLDSATGDVRGTVAIGSPEDVAFLPDGKHALVVGQTTWLDHAPSTPVVRVDLDTGETVSIDVPNCAAPIALLNAGDRALLSPTFCEEGVQSTGDNPWTNPDPVSIIDLESEGPRFVKNLPGFGPVALSEDGERAVAYLDMERIDRTMFDDPEQIPDAAGPRYHVMVIEPSTLEFSLTPIGDALPRFAMTSDGKSLLVDASVAVRREKVEVNAEVTLDSNGLHGSLEVQVFAKDAPFGAFDLETLEYSPFSGPAANLDRFVMPKNGGDVYTLKLRSDGLGGDLYRIGLEAGAVEDLGRSLRDIGLLPDGETLVLRIRSAPLTVEGGVRLQEEYCLSLDGETCRSTISFTSSIVFESEYCSNPENYHDC